MKHRQPCLRGTIGVALVVLTLIIAPACRQDAPKDEARKEAPAAEERPEAEPAPEPAPEPATEPAPEPTAEEAPAPPPPAAPDPEVKGRSLVNAALAAAGGAEALKAGFANYTLSSRGVYGGVAYTMASAWAAPDKMIMDITSERHPAGMGMAYIGDTCWTRMADVVLDCSPADAKGVPMMLWAAHLTTLYPLADEELRLAYTGDADVDGTKAALVDVSKDGGPGVVTFAFSLESGLPVRFEYQGSFYGSEGLISHRILGYTEVDGLKAPAKTEMSFQGGLIMTDEFVSGSFGEADEESFARPGQVDAGTTRIFQIPEHPVVYAVHQGPYTGLGEAIGAAFGCAGANNLMPMSGPLMAYLTGPVDTENADEFVTEIRVEVGPTSLDALQGDGCALKRIPARAVAARVEFGPYDQVAVHYGDLAKWITESGYQIASPAMQATYNDPATTAPEEIASELMFAVVKKADAPAVP